MESRFTVMIKAFASDTVFELLTVVEFVRQARGPAHVASLTEVVHATESGIEIWEVYLR